MEFLYRNKPTQPVDVSIVLLDWNCRESYHILDYLADQTVSRDRYEVIWLEYYEKVEPTIQQRLDAAAAKGQPSPVDTWLVLENPSDVYYHKHLMYNLGIALAHGRIVVVCDSDAIVKPTFVESILKAFEADSDIVLHLDEVRNNSRRFYPFNHPTWEEVISDGAINWSGETTTGILDEEDSLHSRNYGACMAARREDMLAIGGADEHIDYLGHICGPYEMTFRLVNSGRREVWLRDELIYHVWHPGQAGDCNYAGPHDGKHMSTTALSARVTLRVKPLEENPVIAELRRGGVLSDEEILARVLRPEAKDAWDVKHFSHRTHAYDIGQQRIQLHEKRVGWEGPSYAPTYDRFRCGWLTRMKLFSQLYRIGLAKLSHALVTKLRCRKNPGDWGPRAMLKKLLCPMAVLGKGREAGRRRVRMCWEILCHSRNKGHNRVVLYGRNDLIRVLRVFAPTVGMGIVGCCESSLLSLTASKRKGYVEEAALANMDTPVIVAADREAKAMIHHLRQIGVAATRILPLQIF